MVLEKSRSQVRQGESLESSLRETLCPSFKRVKEEDPQELLTFQPHLCAWEGHGTTPSGSCAKAHGGWGHDSGQPCLIILVTFCNGVTTTADKGRATDVADI